MSESIVEQIQARVKTELEAITGDSGTTYWYTPDKVTRCDVFDARLLVAQYQVIYLQRDSGDDGRSDRAFGEEGRAIDIFIQVHKQDTRGEKDPHQAITTAGTIRNRMIKDVMKAMRTNNRHNNLAINTEIESVLRDLASPDGWISAEIMLTITYMDEDV